MDDFDCEKIDLSIAEPSPGSLYDIEEISCVMDELKKYTYINGTEEKNDIEKFEKEFAKYIGKNYAASINGGGVGLDVILRFLDLKTEDEIVSSAVNFHGSHLAILNTKARLILCEASEDLNISAIDLEEKITAKTRAVLLTHMNGLPCNYYQIQDVIKRCESRYQTKIKIIGDAARACGSSYFGKKTGYFEWATMFSFQRKKQMTTLGEGGMVVTDDEELYLAIKRYSAFGHGITWGTNYKLTNLQARIGLCQLNKLDINNHKRIMIAKRRNDYLGEHLKDFKLPDINEEISNTFYLYTLLVPTKWSREKRDLLIRIMYEKYKIGCCVANDVTYRTNTYIQKRLGNVNLLFSESIGDRIITIVIHPNLDIEHENYINASFVNAVKKINEIYGEDNEK